MTHIGGFFIGTSLWACTTESVEVIGEFFLVVRFVCDGGIVQWGALNRERDVGRRFDSVAKENILSFMILFVSVRAMKCPVTVVALDAVQ